MNGAPSTDVVPGEKNGFPGRAFWFSTSAIFNGLALLAATSGRWHMIVCWGGLGLATLTTGVLLERVYTRSTASFSARLRALSDVVLIGAVGWHFLLFAVLLQWVKRGWYGINLVGQWHVAFDGAILASWSVGTALIVMSSLLLWHALKVGRHGGGNARRLILACGLALAVLLVGPEVRIENPQTNAMYAKRSLSDVLRQPFGERATLAIRKNAFPEDERNSPPQEKIVCVGRRSKVTLLFGSDSVASSEEPQSEIEARSWRARCRNEVAEIIAAGSAAESELYRGGVAEFLRQAIAVEVERGSPVAVDISDLPADLNRQLSDLLPAQSRWNFTAFDVALAARRIKEATTLLPDPQAVLPHQRQAMFELGLAPKLTGTFGETSETIAESRRSAALTTLSIGMHFGNADIMRSGLVLAASLGAADYGSFTGGYTGFDFFMVNRHCDLPYAKFLAGLGIAPQPEHVIHLLSTVGRAQYPHPRHPEKLGRFGQADDSLGLPSETQLKHCVALANWYATRLEEPNDDLVKAAFNVAGDAAQTWWWRSFGWDAARETRVVGEPEIAVHAAAAVLDAHPVTATHFCAWAQDWYTFHHLLPQERLQMVQPIHQLFARRRSARGNASQEPRNCDLTSVHGTTAKFEDATAGTRLLNNDIKKFGIPCRAHYRPQEGHAWLSCK